MKEEMKEEKILDIENLSLSYGKKNIINNLSFNVQKADYIAIIGRNGSGKSTLLKYILNLDDKIKVSKESKIYKGEIFNKKGKIGYLSQNISFSNLNFPATVNEVISSGYIYMNINKKAKKEKLNAILKELKIEDLKNKKIGNLSGGQRQKVLIARTIIGGKELIILDEPVSSIDETSKKEIYDILDKINKEGTTIIMITHDLDDAITRAKKIILLDEEQNFYGTTKEYITCKTCREDA